jgi:hypothetical protein
MPVGLAPEPIVEKLGVYRIQLGPKSDKCARHPTVVDVFACETEGSLPSHDFAVDEISRFDALYRRKTEGASGLQLVPKDASGVAVGSGELIGLEFVSALEASDRGQDVP